MDKISIIWKKRKIIVGLIGDYEFNKPIIDVFFEDPSRRKIQEYKFIEFEINNHQLSHVLQIDRYYTSAFSKEDYDLSAKAISKLFPNDNGKTSLLYIDRFITEGYCLESDQIRCEVNETEGGITWSNFSRISYSGRFKYDYLRPFIFDKEEYFSLIEQLKFELNNG